MADPAPAFALTTSVPASWMRSVRALILSAGKLADGLHWDKSGMMVIPACPPMTGKLTCCGSIPSASPMKALARTTSKVETPKTRFGSKTPAAARTSLAIGTVELTGLEIIPIRALGQALAQAAAKSRTIEALVLKRSSRVMPGLRGTPAGMMTTSASKRSLRIEKLWTSQSIQELTVQSLFQVFSAVVSNHLADGVNVRQVRGDSGCVNDIVQRELGDQRAVLQQQGEGLADTT